MALGLVSQELTTGVIKKLTTTTGLALSTDGSGNRLLSPSSTLGSVQSLASAGFVCYTGTNTVAPRSLGSSGTTIDITNPTGAAGDINLDVVDNTSVQKLHFDKAGTLIGTRSTVNFIEGSGVTLTVQDDSGNDRVNVTVAAASPVDAQKFFYQTVAVGYPTAISGGAIAGFDLSTPSSALLALIRDDTDTGYMVIDFNINFVLDYTGSLPGVITFDIGTDANVPVSLSGDNTVVCPVSSSAGTTAVTISKQVSAFADAGANNLVVYVANPDVSNTMSVQEIGMVVKCMYVAAYS